MGPSGPDLHSMSFLKPLAGLGSCIEGFSPQADVKAWSNYQALGSLQARGKRSKARTRRDLVECLVGDGSPPPSGLFKVAQDQVVVSGLQLPASGLCFVFGSI